MVEKIRAHGLLSDEHFTVDGTLLEAWAGAKSFKRKDGKSEPPEDGGSNPTVNFSRRAALERNACVHDGIRTRGVAKKVQGERSEAKLQRDTC